MSKLLVGIVHDLDAERVVEALASEGHRTTRVPSFGGFLGLANSTLLIGAEDDEVRSVLAVFEHHCSAREVELPPVITGRLRDELGKFVRYGGATVFIVELSSIERIGSDPPPLSG